MTHKALLAVVAFFLTLPSALALNCTVYEGEHQELCGIINPLEISENEKETLMQTNVFGDTKVYQDEPIQLNLNLSGEEQRTLDDIYEHNIVRVFHILLFIGVHYVAYAVTTRSSFFLQWVNVDSLT